jgi:hypothetical protein
MVLQVDTNLSVQHVASIFRVDPEDGTFLQKGSYSPASHGNKPGSIPEQVTWDFW